MGDWGGLQVHQLGPGRAGERISRTLVLHYAQQERIDPASKLRELTKNGVGVCHSLAKSPLTNYQTLTNQISLLASLDTLTDLFLYKTQKQPIFRKLVSTVFHFSPKLGFIHLGTFWRFLVLKRQKFGNLGKIWLNFVLK